MNRFARLGLGAAVIGSLAIPATAQTPNPPTNPALPGNQPDYTRPGEPPQAGLAGVIGQMVGNRYRMEERTAITQCAATAQQRAAGQYRVPVATVRVSAITNVERRRSGLRVSGRMNSAARGDLTFRCNFNQRGDVTNIRVNRSR